MGDKSQNDKVGGDEQLDEVKIGNHDLEKAEVQSVQSVNKADDGTGKQAPTRRADQRDKIKMPMEKLPGSKWGVMYDKLRGLTKEDILKVYDYVMNENYADEGEADVEIPVMDLANEQLDQVMEDEATLSEDFKAKTKTIFEATVNAKVREVVESLETEYNERLDEQVNSIREELVEKIDGFLNYVVEQWMQENEVGIEQGIRTEIAENFMEGLRNMFADNYIEVPESKVDLVDELANRCDELEEQLDKAVGELIEHAKLTEELVRDRIVSEASEGLADTQADRLATLAEDVEFEDVESFAAKVETLRGTVFEGKEAPKSDTETLDEDHEVETGDVQELDENMSKYVSAINRNNRGKAFTEDDDS